MTEQLDEKSAEGLTSRDSAQIGWVLVGVGTLGSFYLLIRKNRNIFAWVISVGMIAAGADILLKERHERIVETGDQIMSQLDELDPIARAEVVKYMADQEMERKSE